MQSFSEFVEQLDEIASVRPIQHEPVAQFDRKAKSKANHKAIFKEWEKFLAKAKKLGYKPERGHSLDKLFFRSDKFSPNDITGTFKAEFPKTFR